MGMEVGGIYGTEVQSASYDGTGVKTAAETQKAAEQTGTGQGQAAVYEKTGDVNTDSAKQIYSKENRAAIVKQLKADAAERQAKLAQLVADTMNGQKSANDIAMLFGSGDNNSGTGLKDLFQNLNVDADTIAQAQKDIAEDGYWGVEQTSDRLVEMAKALSGGDTSKADLMMESVKKGFEQATKAWGDDLPSISQKTLDATIEKMTQWRDGTETVA